MKKFLSIIALALFVVLPMSVNATMKVESPIDCTDATKNSEGVYYKTCTIRVFTTDGESLSNFEGVISFEDPENAYFNESGVKGIGEFTATVLEDTISFSSPTPQTGEKIEVGTFTYYIKDLSKECDAILTPTSMGIDTTPSKTETVENPKTGSAVSYIAIGAGVLLVAGAYVLSRKNTKMYNV